MVMGAAAWAFLSTSGTPSNLHDKPSKGKRRTNKIMKKTGSDCHVPICAAMANATIAAAILSAAVK